jgi:hypothetical protein
MELSTSAIPSSFFIAIGVLVLCNIGVIVTLISFIFKAGMFVSTTKAGIKDAKEAAIRAHRRVDNHEKEMHS